MVLHQLGGLRSHHHDADPEMQPGAAVGQDCCGRGWLWEVPWSSSSCCGKYYHTNNTVWANHLYVLALKY
jgi:hypothetical protein